MATTLSRSRARSGDLHRFLRARRHTALLVAIIGSFLVRPIIGEGSSSMLAFSLALIFLLLIALYTVQIDDTVGPRDTRVARRRRRQWWIGLALALPAITERLVFLLTPSPRFLLVSTLSWFAFFAFITWTELRTVLDQKEVTGETISMSVSVYLLLGVTWGLAFIILHQLHPGAFGFATPAGSAAGSLAQEQELFPVFVYFSLTTLSTVGYGDITPVTLQARYASVAEAITGQFYLAILVARLVSMQMNQAAIRQGSDNRREDERRDAPRGP